MTNRRRAFVIAALLLSLGGAAFAAKSSVLGRPSSGPLALFAFPDGARVTFDARVVSRAVAGPYVYLEVERDGGERAWIVTLASSEGAAAGVAVVHVVAIGHASHFVSRRLSRSFDDLYFAVVRRA